MPHGLQGKQPPRRAAACADTAEQSGALKEFSLIRDMELWRSADEVHRFLFSELKMSELCCCCSAIDGRSDFGVFAQL